MMTAILLRLAKIAIGMGMSIAAAAMAFGTIFIISKMARKTIGACT